MQRRPAFRTMDRPVIRRNFWPAQGVSSAGDDRSLIVRRVATGQPGWPGRFPEDARMLMRSNGRTWALVILLVAAGAAVSGEEAPIGRGVGNRVANFELKDVTTGRSVSLYGYWGKKAVV